MKKLIALLLAIMLCISMFLLSACGTSKSWNKKDFNIYNTDGDIIDSVHIYSDPDQHVSLGSSHCDKCKDIDKSNAVTKRGVSIGDDAIESLKKYDLTYAHYYDGETMQELTDLETVINENESVQIIVYLNKNYKNIDSYDAKNKVYLRVSFDIRDGAIEGYDVHLRE